MEERMLGKGVRVRLDRLSVPALNGNEENSGQVIFPSLGKISI